MVRVEYGKAIEVEVWELPTSAFGGFVDGVPPPLAIGTVELADGESVKGFVCESYGVAERRRHHRTWGLAAIPRGKQAPTRRFIGGDNGRRPGRTV